MNDSAGIPVELTGTIKLLSFLAGSSAEDSSFRFILRNAEGRLFSLRYSHKNYETAKEVHHSLISDMQIKVLIKGPIQNGEKYYDVVGIIHMPAVTQ
ncbi:MAG: hypothetical protein RBT20_05500 [Syntrophales bacterium]|nr:hypothetical protein [Syntrophales bacterium]